MPRKRPNPGSGKVVAKYLSNLASNVRKYRIEAALTQQELATAAHLATTTIHEIESEKLGDVRLTTLCAIAKTLKKDPIKLIETRS